MTDSDLERRGWFGGQLIGFSALDGPADFDTALAARTSFDAPGLDIVLPARCRIRFSASGDIATTISSDCVRLRSASAQTTAVFLDCHHILMEGPCDVVECEAAIRIAIRGNRTLVGVAEMYDEAKLSVDVAEAVRERDGWLAGLELPDGLQNTSRRTLAKALSVMKTQVYSPKGRIHHTWTTPDRWPHRGMWLWDSVFHAIGWRHVDLQLARDMISAVLDMQREDGFVAHHMRPDWTSGITQPPVLALGVKLVNEIAEDTEWMESLYPKLCAYVEWDLANRDTDGAGLVEWFIEGNPDCRSGESGMDNSPRFDTATQLDATDFNAFLALECEVLAEFARKLGRQDDAAKWGAKHERLCVLIDERLWSYEQDFYIDYDVDRGVQSTALASAGFLPLICGAPSKERAEKLAAHLGDPTMFGTALPVASIAAKDAEHYSKDMWRGPVWVNVNWLIARGFDRYGMHSIAAELREKTMREIESRFEQHGTVFEFYDDRREASPPELLRKGKCAPEVSPYHQVFHDYGWTATLYVDMAYSLARS